MNAQGEIDRAKFFFFFFLGGGVKLACFMPGDALKKIDMNTNKEMT